MITAIIFAIHFIFIVTIFTYKWQQETTGSAFINVALILVLFAVGWSITGLLVKLFIEPEGFGIMFDRDTFSLTLLTIIEYFFYRFYYNEKVPTEAGTEKQ
jgi:hypothetical protein